MHSEPTPVLQRNRLVRGAFAAAGLGFVGLGIVGVILPGWPTTIFAILALWCFKRSCPRLERWLLENRYVGPTLRDWDENKWIRMRTKRIAIAAMTVFVVGSCFLIRQDDLWAAWSIRAAILLLGAIGVWYVASRRTKPEPGEILEDSGAALRPDPA